MPGEPWGSIDELFEQFGAVVFRRCRQMLRSDAAASDAVQEVFVRVLKKQESFRGESSPLTWIYRIATTYCLQQLRNQKRRQAKHEQLQRDKGESSGTNVVDRVSLEQILNEIDLVTQEIVYLRYIDEMTLEEVADVVRLSRKTVQDRLTKFRATARLALSGEEA